MATKRQFDKNKAICANCQFFDEFPVQKSDDNLLGSCKANPPFPGNDFSDSKMGIWPLVLGSFWCGVFEHKEEKK